ncbi:hypothetical protein RDV89_15945 [Nocardioides zeae]|uniref:SGNH hydrolase-type esterase domain-containing protein n=1 Tax=Nocardioides imazamoxiresistens TaxID=3231893 RepID=A0ABU3PZA4_9ACTN|nr:hypothetical protein [Nocardioides zeae]MDT9594577.1 hypothetical protein [Nocardioides zeae]
MVVRPRDRVRTRSLLTLSLVAAALAAPGAALAAPTGPPSDPAPGPSATASARTAELPTAAVALGDSFVSGEGAGDYRAVPDENGVAQAFPGWDAPNSNAYFCHRSANASIEVAELDGIDARFNLACSGGRPADVAQASSAREGGRGVAAQLEQLRSVAGTHDIDLVLVGLGSNNSTFTFGDVAAECAGRFVGDGYTGWWEVWIHLLNWITGSELPERPCTEADLASAEQLAAAQAETAAAVGQILDTLAEIDPDGEHRVVLQDYTNPLPEAYAQEYLTESGRDDGRDKFRALVDERYAAGCPAHVASLGPAHGFSAGLGTLVGGVADTVRTTHPDSDVVYLDVQSAFDGARLCEAPGSPTTALATPLRVMDGPSGQHVESFAPFDKLDIKRVTDTCQEYYQTCQESWHPNVAGHEVLGRCLTGAASTASATVTCVRQPDGTVSTG